MKVLNKAELIPIDSIRILNPRTRSKKKAQELFTSMEAVGLKKPITVCRRRKRGEEPKYDLVCGQGRLESAKELGWGTIPAIIIDVPEEDRYLMSLAENLARVRRSGIDRLRQIADMEKRGVSINDIVKSTGLGISYIQGILRLLKAGEERLLRSVEQGRISLSIAITIARTDDKSIQKALREAFENGQLSGAALLHAKRLVDQRSAIGNTIFGGKGKQKGMPRSAEELVRVYNKEADRQKMLIKKNQVCETRLRFTVSAFRQLFSDENFTTLLRAESLETYPKNLADLISRKGA